MPETPSADELCMSTTSQKFLGLAFNERSHLVTSPRGDVYIPSLSFLLASSRKVNSLLSLSPSLFLACHDRVNGFYCSFAVIVEYTPRFPSPGASYFIAYQLPGRTRFLGTKSRNPTAFYRRGIKRVPSSRGHEVHKIQLSRAARSAFDPWLGCTESFLVPTFRPCRASPATFAVPRISSYGENIENMLISNKFLF